MSLHLQILTADYLEQFSSKVDVDRKGLFASLSSKDTFEHRDFEYYIQSSATYSSNIEGNSIDINTYLKNKMFNVKSKPKEMAEIDDLIAAYNYAVATKLDLKSFLEAHKLLAKRF